MVKVLVAALALNSIACLAGLAVTVVQATAPLRGLPSGESAVFYFLLPLAGNVLVTLLLMLLRFARLRPGWLRIPGASAEAQRNAWVRLNRLTRLAKISLGSLVLLSAAAAFFGSSVRTPAVKMIGVLFVTILFLSPWILLYGTLYDVDGSFLEDER